MRGLILLAFLLLVINAESIDDSDRINVNACGERPLATRVNLNDKIVGGEMATIGDWGWQVAMNRNGKFICGGSLINRQWILTAAHCVHGATNPLIYSILVGAHNRVNIEYWARRSTVSKVIVHPKFNPAILINDIALMKLSALVEYSDYIIPVCIDDGSYNYTGVSSWASGWGSMSNAGSETTELYDVKMEILTDKRCKDKYKVQASIDIKSEIQLCAGENFEGKDTCKGDSGGPLVVKNPKNGRWYSHGITSYGRSCGHGGVYARTSAFYSWIQNIITSN